MCPFQYRSLSCLVIMLMVVGCSSSRNDPPDLQTFDEAGMQVDYTSSVPLSKVKNFHRFLMALKSQRNLDLSNKRQWLDRGEKFKIISMTNPEILNDASAMAYASKIPKLASRFAFDCEIIEYHMVDENYATFKILEIDPLEDFAPQSSVQPVRSTLNGTLLLFMDAVQDGQASDASALINWTGEAMFAVEQNQGEGMEAMRDLFIAARLKVRRTHFDQWFQTRAFQPWVGAKAYFSEAQSHTDDLTKVTMVVVTTAGKRFPFEILAKQGKSGNWSIFSIAMIEPTFNADAIE